MAGGDADPRPLAARRRRATTRSPRCPRARSPTRFCAELGDGLRASRSSTSRTPTWSATPASIPAVVAGGRDDRRVPRPRSSRRVDARRRRLPRHRRPRQRREDARGRTASARTPRTRRTRCRSSSRATGVELRDGRRALRSRPDRPRAARPRAFPVTMTGASLLATTSVTCHRVANRCTTRTGSILRRALSLPQPDLGVLRKAQRGDERAFSLIVRTYEPPVYNYVLRLVGDRRLAEDLTQEVFLRVYQGLPSFSLRSRSRPGSSR